MLSKFQIGPFSSTGADAVLRRRGVTQTRLYEVRRRSFTQTRLYEVCLTQTRFYVYAVLRRRGFTQTRLCEVFITQTQDADISWSWTVYSSGTYSNATFEGRCGEGFPGRVNSGINSGNVACASWRPPTAVRVCCSLMAVSAVDLLRDVAVSMKEASPRVALIVKWCNGYAMALKGATNSCLHHPRIDVT